MPSCWGGGQRLFRAAQGPASPEVAAKAAVLKQPQREGWWAGGGIWGTAIMWLTSDSCTTSPVTSSCSPLDSPSAQELRGEMGHGERKKGEGFQVRLQAAEDAATLPFRGHRLAGPGACLGHPECQRQGEGWDPGFLVLCRLQGGGGSGLSPA